jgi:hypothetical protein
MKCRACDDTVPAPRAALGYRTCLSCGEAQARTIKRCVVPQNKQAYMLVTNYAELAMLNPKRT